MLSYYKTNKLILRGRQLKELPWIGAQFLLISRMMAFISWLRHQIESFEDFIRNKLPLIVCSTAPIVVWHEQDEATKKYKYEFRLSFENISYIKPRIQEATGRIKPMFPQDARTRNFTYSAQMFCDIRFTTRAYKAPTYSGFDEEVKVFEGVSFRQDSSDARIFALYHEGLPASKEEIGECTHDPFGYFLIHGSERTILSQEKVADNQIMIFFNKKTSSKFGFSAEMKSLHESFTTPPKKLEIRISSKFNGFGYPLTACVPRFREDIPLMVLFRAFGLESDQEIAELIWGKIRMRSILICLPHHSRSVRISRFILAPTLLST